jgi:hypothetical protein
VASHHGDHSAGPRPCWIRCGRCADACGIPLPDAELLIRWSTAHPDWVDPLKVDSHHPDAGELIELGTRIAARKHCIDLSEVDE